MLDVNRTRVIASQMMSLASTVASIEEGSLVATYIESGKAVIAAADGTSGQVIAGVTRSQILNPTTAPKVEIVTVPSSSPYTVTLAKTPISPGATTVSAVRTDTLAKLTYNATDADGRFSISGKTVTFNSAQAGVEVKITYRYTLTLIEAQMLYGMGIGDAAQSVVNGSEVITHAQVLYTDKYDASSNWENPTALYSGAGGVFTMSTSGVLLPKCYVIEAPTAANGLLGVYINF